ncbi:MAG TPA: tripartite tricarboxylate transporter substrate binding protein [Burkholderiales bacterium]|nr:tripartite tricarboxylate transporter substrate binding protein [Burkholderiales bacterium]
MRLLACICAACVALCSHCAAQNYPDKTVSLVVAFPAGGSTDPLARALAQQLSEGWGQNVVVINRPGAGGNIGAESVARAAPDGYTLLVGTTALATSPSLYRNLGYDVLKDLAPVSQLMITPNVLVVHPSVPARSPRELIALAQARPGRLSSGSAGAGSSNHLALVLFNAMAHVDILHVPYKGAAPAVADVVGGHVDMTFAPVPAVLTLIESGRLRALAVTSARRSPVLPDTATLAEAAIAGYEAASWAGLCAPAATPKPLIAHIHAAVAQSLRAASVRQAFLRLGAEPVGGTPDEFAQLLRREIAKWGRVLKSAGVSPE